jgi:enoyl-[acyl-carrier protein] reductase I
MSDRPQLLAGCRGVILGVSGENSIGYHLVRDFVALGAQVAATYRPARRDTVAPLLEAAGVSQHAALDAGDEATIERAVSQFGQAWGRLDFLVHTLVHVPEGLLARPLLSVTREEFHEVVDATAYSLIAVCRHAAPYLARSAHPRVVALTSASAVRMTPNYHVAGIAKAALGGVLLYLAAELGPRGILCNSVGFSLIETDAARRAIGAANAAATRAHLQKRTPTRRAVDPEHVTRAIGFFASPLCENVTGEVLMVDGGFRQVYL